MVNKIYSFDKHKGVLELRLYIGCLLTYNFLSLLNLLGSSL
jgi:hypothetical protein